MKVMMNGVRLCFPKLFQPESVGKGDGKYYSAAFPIEPGSANHKALEAAIQEEASKKWGAKAKGILETIREKGDIAYKHKPLKSAEGDIYDGFEGMYTLNASLDAKKGKPLVIDRDRSPLAEDSGRPYAGCYVNASVEVWMQDNENGKRANVQLRGVQFVRDGDRFGAGAPATADEFEEIPDEAFGEVPDEVEDLV